MLINSLNFTVLKLLSYQIFGPQPFQFFSSSVEKNILLPSGDKLRLEIQFDLTEFILFRILLLIVFECGIVGLFYILLKSMKASIQSVTKPLEEKISWLNEIARDLPDSARANTNTQSSNIVEIDDLGSSIGSLTSHAMPVIGVIATGVASSSSVAKRIGNRFIPRHTEYVITDQAKWDDGQ